MIIYPYFDIFKSENSTVNGVFPIKSHYKFKQWHLSIYSKKRDKNYPFVKLYKFDGVYNYIIGDLPDNASILKYFDFINTQKATSKQHNNDIIFELIAG